MFTPIEYRVLALDMQSTSPISDCISEASYTELRTDFEIDLDLCPVHRKFANTAEYLGMEVILRPTAQTFYLNPYDHHSIPADIYCKCEYRAENMVAVYQPEDFSEAKVLRFTAVGKESWLTIKTVDTVNGRRRFYLNAGTRLAYVQMLHVVVDAITHNGAEKEYKYPLLQDGCLASTKTSDELAAKTPLRNESSIPMPCVKLLQYINLAQSFQNTSEWRNHTLELDGITAGKTALKFHAWIKVCFEDCRVCQVRRLTAEASQNFLSQDGRGLQENSEEDLEVGVPDTNNTNELKLPDPEKVENGKVVDPNPQLPELGDAPQQNSGIDREGEEVGDITATPGSPTPGSPTPGSPTPTSEGDGSSSSDGDASSSMRLVSSIHIVFLTAVSGYISSLVFE